MAVFKKCGGIHREKGLARKWPEPVERRVTHPYSLTLLPTGSGHFWAKLSSLWIPIHFLNIVILHISAYEDGIECSETSAYEIQTPGNYPEESTRHDFNLLGNRILTERTPYIYILLYKNVYSHTQNCPHFTIQVCVQSRTKQSTFYCTSMRIITHKTVHILLYKYAYNHTQNSPHFTVQVCV